LDQRSTAESSRFLLRVPEFLWIYIPVLPPVKILANKSCILWSSPCLLCIIAPEVLFTCFSMLAL
jgi:hypothetical protein